MKILYTAVAHATGDGRNGHVQTDDGRLELDVRIPVAMGGAGGATNPEQLFAAGYSACFLGAMKFVASQGGTAKVPDDTNVTATVGIGPRSEGGFGLEVDLKVSLPGVPREEAQALVEKAHQVCPYSNATRNNMDVRLTVA